MQAQYVGLTPTGHKFWFTTHFAGDLSQILGELLTDQERLVLTYRVLDASLSDLQRLHVRQICHGDIKPENLFWNEFGDIALGDFHDVFTVNQDHPHFFRKLHGTYRYWSPEARQQDHSERAVKGDVFSLGLTALELISPREFDRFVANVSSANDHDDQDKKERDLASERHAMLNAFVTSPSNALVWEFALQHRYGDRWQALHQAVDRLDALDPALASLIVDGMLAISTADRLGAEELLVHLRSLAQNSASLLQAIRPADNVDDGDKMLKTPSLAVRGKWFREHCRDALKNVAEYSESPRQGRSDLYQLRQYVPRPLRIQRTSRMLGSWWAPWARADAESKARSSSLGQSVEATEETLPPLERRTPSAALLPRLPSTPRASRSSWTWGNPLWSALWPLSRRKQA